MKILAVAPIVPYPLHDGDKHRLFHLLQGMSRQHEVTLLALTRDPAGLEQAQSLLPMLHEIQVHLLPDWRLYWNSLKTVLSPVPFNVGAYAWPVFQGAVTRKLAQEHFDLIFAYRLRMAPYVQDLSLPKILDLTDALSLFMPRLAAKATLWKRPYLELEAARMRSYEPGVCRQFDACLISSEEDLAHLRERGASNLHWISNGIAALRLRPSAKRPPRNAATLLFTGNMGYYPNQQGIRWFRSEIWPLIRRATPAAELQVVGGNPPDWMRMWDGAEGITVTGEVPDMRPYLWRATALVCPLQVGSGVRFKILEAMAAGLPVVTTRLGCEGLKVSDGREALIADEPPAFAAATIGLVRDPRAGKALARRASDVCRRWYDWPVIHQRVARVIRGSVK